MMADVKPVTATGALTLRQVLSRQESEAMYECEEAVQRGLGTFLEVGRALITICNRRLYREQYETFEDYCRKRWNMSSARARQNMQAVEVVGNLASAGAAVLPVAESQARPLGRLPQEERLGAWQEAVAASRDGRPTAKDVEAAVTSRKPKESRPRRVEAAGDQAGGADMRRRGEDLPAVEAGRWPKPDVDGLYRLDQAHMFMYRHKQAQAVIALLQIGPDRWLSGTGYSYRTGNYQGNSTDLNQTSVLPGRPEAMMAAAASTIDKHREIIKRRGKPGSSTITLSQVEQAKRIISWSEKLREAAAEEIRLRGGELEPSIELAGIMRNITNGLDRLEELLSKGKDADSMRCIRRAFMNLQPVLAKYAGAKNRKAEVYAGGGM